MGILNKLMGQGSKSRHVAITSIGKRKVEEGSSGLRFSILSHLEDSGSSSYSEIAEATGKNEHRIRTVCKMMIKDGEIKESESISEE